MAFGFGHRLLRRLTGRDRREAGRLNHVSLGSHCHMAQILKAAGLRTWSAPFDWIFSSPGMVRDCLADDFSDLLDRTQYESTPLAERPAPHEWSCRHRLYGERHAIPFVFNHHDPAASPADYRFLCEGVRRLRAALDDGRATNRFYLLTALPSGEDVPAALADLLAARGADNRLLFMQLASGAERRAERLTSPRPNLAWLRVATRTASTGLRFADPDDDAFVEGLVREFAH